MAATSARQRSEAVRDLKRSLILAAARSVFESEGLEGASLRAIAARAGYTPAALYFHYPSKEAIYADLLNGSLQRLAATVAAAGRLARSPAQRLKAAAMAFFAFYAANPRDLDLGFYLFRGGMRPKGLGADLDRQLNAALADALAPVAAHAASLGATPEAGRAFLGGVFAHATGLLLMAHTGRIRMFKVSAESLMQRYVEDEIARLKGDRSA